MACEFKPGEPKIVDGQTPVGGGEVVDFEAEECTQRVVGIPGVGVFREDQLPPHWQYVIGRLKKHLGLPAPDHLN
jgi:hypothetical protein